MNSFEFATISPKMVTKFHESVGNLRHYVHTNKKWQKVSFF